MTAPELTVLPASPAAPSQDYLRAARRVRRLSWLSLAWMGAEGTIAIVSGIVAGSIALVGFGLDSAIEGFASAIIIWRFTGDRIHSHAAEDRAQKLVAIQFFLLALYITVEAVSKLISGAQPETSWLGMELRAAALRPPSGRQRPAATTTAAAERGQ